MVESDGRFEVRWKDGQVEIMVRCSRRVFITVFTTLMTLLTALQQVVVLLNKSL